MADSTVKPDDTNDLVLQNNHGASKIEVNEDDTIVVTSGGDATIDATGDIILDAGGADIKLKDGGVQFGTLKQASTHLVIQPESSKEIILNDGSGTASLTVDAANQNVSINNGNLVMGTAGKGIDFAAQTTSATGSPDTDPGDEVLNHYETGSWTATSENGGIASYGNQTGYYTRIGRLVQVQFFSAAWVTNSAVDPYITGLPFSASSAAYGYSGGYSFHDTWNPGSSTGFIPPGGTTIRFLTRDDTGYTVTPSSGSQYIMFTAIYMTDL
ncbi:hypothetical protein CMI37_21515 [Candidatus Pacearchaeota archaeon]|nr:hypothetical protein [Candidatus Pacearchaeota archaeon]